MHLPELSVLKALQVRHPVVRELVQVEQTPAHTILMQSPFVFISYPGLQVHRVTAFVVVSEAKSLHLVQSLFDPPEH